MRIPFLDLALQYQSLKSEINETVQRVLTNGQWVGGPEVISFEKNFANYHGVSHCISTGNGTDSLFAAIKANGIGPGDDVITPAWSWISTSETISLASAKPIFADADVRTFNLSIEDVERKITSHTKAIIAVHLYGQCCNMEALQKICKEKNLILIEDCAQSHGAQRNGKLAGTFGHVSSFSFYPTKNLGALGDAGCLLSNSEELAINLRRFVNHGGLTKDEHLIEGMNSRMDALQAAVLHTKLKYLAEWNSRRQTIANHYIEQLKSVDAIQLPITDSGNEHVYHLFVIRSKQRDALKEFLQSQGVETIVHYPKALPFEPAYASRHFMSEDFPVAHSLQHEVLSLPCHPNLTDAEVAYICDTIKKFSYR
jgi:dTDP-4-amino-4,6-dideoxygalactose transaminase